MSFRLACDVEACSAEIQSGPGQPTLAGKQRLYCARCQSYIAAVDKEVEREANRRGFALVEELDALRKKLLTEVLPAQKGGEGMKADWVIEEAR